MEEEAESSSSSALALALVALVVVPAVALLVRARWRRAAARREEVRRLARLAAEEAELAERESVLAYYSELFPGVVHAAEVPVAPEWGPPPVVAVPGPAAQEEFDAQPQPPVGAKGVCAVCFKPTTFRCKQCKAVKYCSFKCQIAHWRQGHKDECHPPSVNTRPDDEGKAEQGRAAEENVSVGVKQVAEMNKPVVGSGTSDANHNLKSSNGKSKHMPSEAVCTRAEVPGGHQSNSTVEISQNVPVSVDNSKMGSSIKHTNFVEDGSSTVDLNGASPCKSQASPPNINGHSSFVSEEFCNHSKKHQRAKDASVVEDCSQANNNREVEDSSIPQAAASVVLEPKSSRTPIHVELERSKTKPVGNDSIQSTKPVPSALTVDKATSVRGSSSITPNPSKVADNLPDRSFKKPSDRSGSTANNLATSLKKMVRQQTAPKVVRHYPSESTLFPYELFVKLYGKVELHPFGLHNVGNSCYANAVLQCLMFTRPLTTYLLEGLHSKNCSQKGWCFMCEFEKLIVEGKRHKTALSPTGILSHLHDIGSSLGPGKQEDAHEFLRYAIDAMQSVCMKEARKGGGLRSAEETTLVQLIFGGYLQSKIKCSRCHVSSEQCEPMLDLTVEIDGDISSLDEALVRFTSTEVLDGENKYHCSRCKSYERAKKKLTIEEAPNILTIALKRYQSGKFGKISKAIRFPETLNMLRYMNPDTDDISPIYSLYAVVVHHDVMNAAFSGHYVCYVKDTQGKWFKADDSQVKPVSLDNVMSKCAYMLLYARCSPRAPSSVRQAMGEDPTHPKKAKQKVVLGGTTWRGGSLNRHQAGQPHRDHTADDLTHAFDEYRDAPYSPSDSPSPSESSSLFSNSDAGSHSTVSTDSSESTRNSTSTEEYEYVFGAADQMYPGGPMGGAPAESDYPTYSRSSSSLNTSSSGREAYSAYSSAEHKLHGGSGGLWVEGDDSPSLLYTDRSNQQLSSKLTDQYRQLDRSRHDPGETRGGVLLRRPSRDRTAQMMSRVLGCREIM